MLITDLPAELFEEILLRCDPIEVAKIAQTCIAFRRIIYFSDDTKLWRDLYIAQPFDDPRQALSQDGRPVSTPIQWRRDLQRIIRARTVVEDVSLMRPGELESILQTLLMMVSNVPPWTDQDNLSDFSNNILWVAAFLRHGFIDKMEATKSSLTFAERQLLGRLHSLYGLTQADATRQSRINSRAFVYHMRNYRPENDYGPFLPNGAVNWEHVQTLHHVVSMHLVDLKEDEDFEFAIFPMSLPYTQIVVPKGVVLDKERDWAGVEGSWAVSFCFCDHRDLLRFNEESSETDLDTTLFEDPGFREVFRSLDVKLCITRTEHDPAHPTRPILYFFGQMEDPSTSTMTGMVQVTTDNQVKWHFVSGDQGNAIWSSAGVQVGGLRSSFGILGSWTTVFHDSDDPVGPFWLRKHIHTDASPPV
ncbi:hypothetical protein B0H34DRAFT_706937 [Crassisporium funariophilum]|nr:hypothetical protein B0H34DRAFT_706937 [Crassisporium funariophilum]